eukprot:3368537-Prymnesium_polylepis.1
MGRDSPFLLPLLCGLGCALVKGGGLDEALVLGGRAAAILARMRPGEVDGRHFWQLRELAQVQALPRARPRLVHTPCPRERPIGCTLGACPPPLVGNCAGARRRVLLGRSAHQVGGGATNRPTHHHLAAASRRLLLLPSPPPPSVAAAP